MNVTRPANLSRYKKILIITPSSYSITPVYITKREQNRWCMSVGWDAAVRSETGGKGECEDNTEANAMLCHLQQNYSSSFDFSSHFQNF